MISRFCLGTIYLWCTVAVTTTRAQMIPPLRTNGADPEFGTEFFRFTDTTTTGGWATQIYSQLQAFSGDNEYVLLIENGSYVVRRVQDGVLLLDGGTSAPWNAPRWHPAQANSILHYDSNEDTTIRVQVTNVETLATITIFTFPNLYDRVFSNQSFDEVSLDGAWVGGAVSRNDGAMVLFALDIARGVLTVEIPVPDLFAGPCAVDPVWGMLEPDWVGVSSLGNYLMVQWARDGTDRCSGLESFDIQTGTFLGRVYDGHQHGDLGIMQDGTTEFFMTTSFSSREGNGLPSIVIHRLPGIATVQPLEYVRTIPWNDGGHISCRGPPGVCAVSTFPTGTDFDNEVYLQYVDGRVRRLVHHRSSSCGYWVQARASISRDGEFVIFASDWSEEAPGDSCTGTGGNDMGQGEAYIIRVDTAPPAGFVGGNPGNPGQEPVPNPVPVPAPSPDLGNPPPPPPAGPPIQYGPKILDTTLDSSESILTWNGNFVLDSSDFVVARNGNGIMFSDGSSNQYVSFPTSGTMNLEAGQASFWYRPNYDAGADDETHALLVVGDVYNPPNLVLLESDTLRLSATTLDWQVHGTEGQWRSPYWKAGDWVKISIAWDNMSQTDSLRIDVNDVRVDLGGAPGGWDISGASQFFVGSSGATGGFGANGIVDEFKTFGTSRSQTPPPPPPPPSDGGDILLNTSLDGRGSIVGPTVGVGGTSNLQASDFAEGHQGGGAKFVGDGKFAEFPVGQNINLHRGEARFWYRPNYDAAADDITHYLFVAGDLYNPASLALIEADTLKLVVTTSDWTSRGAAASWRAPLWKEGEWVQIRAVWDNTSTSDSLRIYVNEQRVDSGGVPGGWEIEGDLVVESLFIGSGNKNGAFPSQGVVDEFTISSLS